MSKDKVTSEKLVVGEDMVFYYKGEKIVLTYKQLVEEQKRLAARNWLPTPLPLLQYWRLYRKLTRQQLAEATGLHLNTITNLERGATLERPQVVASNDTIKKLMAALDVPFASWFFELDEFTTSLVLQESINKEQRKGTPVEDLKAQRKAAGLSQEALAERAGVHVSTVRTADRGGSISQASRQSISTALPGRERT